ncbi:MAG TPA: sugar ABC transporter permease, partial [bacterium]|nr:sugar ABC transporter permease [bacterium]
AVIAFKDFRLGDTIFSAPWVGLKWFKEFFSSMYFWRLMKNTLLINFYSLIFGFPIPIIFALVVNEIRIRKFKKLVQTISYMPYFISTVIVVGILHNFFGYNHGIVNNIIESMGYERIRFFMESQYFRPLYIGSGIWQSFGYSSIIYIAAMSGVNVELYEAAVIDGANRLQQIWHITLPAIRPTIVILLILNVGRLMSEGFEKIILMYSPATYEVADVISTYVYRRGLIDMEYSFSTAIGLYNSVINFLLLVVANAASRRISGVSLW